MKYLYAFIIIYFFLPQKADCESNPFIAGGALADIDKFPHSIYLYLNCTYIGVCTGSILNQVIVLTAAHCVETCTYQPTESVIVHYGHATYWKMKETPMKTFTMHEKYDTVRFDYDIALILTKNVIPLGRNVKRVILMQSPPIPKYAYVAGFGIDENGASRNFKYTEVLMHTPKVCAQYTKPVTGVFCGGPITGLGWPDSGDSGAGLMVDGTIQIGVVAYKVAKYRLTAYTNTSFFLSWIKKEATNLYCHRLK